MTQKFFEILPSGTRIDFIGKWKYVFPVSVAMVVVSIFALSTKGLNYSVDFKGGTDIHVRFFDRLPAAEVRGVLATLGLSEAMVQGYGEKDSGEFLIRLEPENLRIGEHKERLQEALDSAAPSGGGKARIRFQEDRLYVTYEAPADLAKLKEAVNALALPQLKVDEVRPFGQASANEYVVQFAGLASKVMQAFRAKLGPGKFEILSVEQVGARVGSELRTQAIGAILISMILIGIFIWFRFDMMFAPGAVISLFHDPLAVLLVFSVFGLQFDLSVVAAMLTLIGFSINDTIVIYDRVRENLKKNREIDLPSIMNQAINECLGRTVLTTGTVLMTALALMFLGGPITFNFALAFAVGLVMGVYSTVYVCCPITIMVHNYMVRKASLR